MTGLELLLSTAFVLLPIAVIEMTPAGRWLDGRGDALARRYVAWRRRRLERRVVE